MDSIIADSVKGIKLGDITRCLGREYLSVELQSRDNQRNELRKKDIFSEDIGRVERGINLSPQKKESRKD